jgi:YD repeat-containing protein
VQSTPANNAFNQSTTLTLTWTPPGNAIPGTTTYTVSLWDPYGGNGGHLLADLASTTNSSTSVPSSESLFYGQTYYWNVNACNGQACAGYNSVWFAFTTQAQPAVTLSGAAQMDVVNGDFSGPQVPDIAGFPEPAGWNNNFAGHVGAPHLQLTQNSNGFNVLCNVISISSMPLALDYPSGGKAWFRMAYQQSGGASAQVSFNGTLLYSSTTMGWQEAVFAVPSSAGSSGSFTISRSDSTMCVGYLERLDGPAAKTGPHLGGDGRLPKALGSIDGGGADATTGAYVAGHTDLALPGVMGLSFTRSYDNQDVTATLSGGNGYAGPLGPKWTHNWRSYLSTLDGSDVLIRLPGGMSLIFTLNGGTWTPPAGVDASLVLSGGQWTLTTAGQMRYVFNGSGQLTSVLDRNSNSTALSYDAYGNLSRITDPGGRYIQLNYQSTGANGVLASVADSAGRTVSYSYSGTTGDLTSVTDVLNGTTQYAYNDHWLTEPAPVSWTVTC